MYTVIGADSAVAKLRGLSIALRHTAPAFETVGQRFRSQVEAQFAMGGLLPGVSMPWHRLSPFTREHKHGGRILIDRTLLLQSYTDPRAKGNISEARDGYGRFGSSYKTRNNKGRIVPIVKFHQEGTIHMPERPVALGNRFLDEDICDAFVQHLFKAWV